MLQSTSIVVYLIRSSDCLVMLKYVPSIKFAPVNYFLTIENTVTYLVLCFDDVIMTYKGCCVTKDSFHNFGSSSQIRSLEYSSPPPPASLAVLRRRDSFNGPFASQIYDNTKLDHFSEALLWIYLRTFSAKYLKTTMFLALSSKRSFISFHCLSYIYFKREHLM